MRIKHHTSFFLTYYFFLKLPYDAFAEICCRPWLKRSWLRWRGTCVSLRMGSCPQARSRLQTVNQHRSKRISHPAATLMTPPTGRVRGSKSIWLCMCVPARRRRWRKWKRAGRRWRRRGERRSRNRACSARRLRRLSWPAPCSTTRRNWSSSTWWCILSETRCPPCCRLPARVSHRPGIQREERMEAPVGLPALTRLPAAGFWWAGEGQASM